MNEKEKARMLITDGKYFQARELLHEKLQQMPNDPEILFGIGVAFFHEADYELAARWISRAVDLDPDSALLHFHLANSLRGADKIDDAIEHYQIAVSLQPKMFEVHLMLASALLTQKQLEDAEHHFNYALELNPGNIDCLANLAQIYELSHDLDRAKLFSEMVLNTQPGHPGALLTLGKLKKREGQYEEAEEAFRAICSRTTDSNLLAITNIELGHVLDKLGRYNDAYCSYIEGNKYWEKIVKGIGFDRRQYQTYIDNGRRWFCKENFSVFPDMRKAALNLAPIFLVGFPRSGTTLVEQVLKQHPEVITSNETPYLQESLEWYLAGHGAESDDFGFLRKSSTVDLSSIGDEYWRRVIAAEGDIEGKVFIDKLPLNIIHLGFINKIFPDARIIVAIRDPRDACLSCFMQGFTPNPAMINYLTLKSSVEFYHQVMSLWLQYRSRLTLKFYQYKYEDLVDNFSVVSHELFSFLGLDYPEGAERYYESAKTRVINTPSYQDVTRPLYRHGINRWKNYSSYLEPYMDTLSPYVEEFGYLP